MTSFKLKYLDLSPTKLDLNHYSNKLKNSLYTTSQY
jgi:hypothetical protein